MKNIKTHNPTKHHLFITHIHVALDKKFCNLLCFIYIHELNLIVVKAKTHKKQQH